MSSQRPLKSILRMHAWKDALVKQKAEGLTRKLCCLTLSDNRVIALGKEPIRTEDGRIVGWVSSGGYGYSVGQSIVYAYLPMECTKVGTHLEIEFFSEPVGDEGRTRPTPKIEATMIEARYL
jgi:glycine cleavage system aminomethyltransferase T